MKKADVEKIAAGITHFIDDRPHEFLRIKINGTVGIHRENLERALNLALSDFDIYEKEK